MNIDVGKIVRLKSGSPDLRVTEILQSARVEWKNEQGVTHSAEFPLACLSEL